MKRFYIFIIIVLISPSGKGQDPLKNDLNNYYSVNQLKSDFVFFRAIMEKVHPSLYRYTSKDSIDHYFNQGLSKLDHPLNEIEFWKILQQIVAKTGSGHTDLTLSKASANKYNYTTHNVLPFSIYIKGNRLFVRNFIHRADSLLKTGTEILAINNEPALSLLLEQRGLTSGDGYTNSYKDWKIEGSFSRVYNLLHGDKQQFVITFKTADAAVKTASFKAVRTIYLDPTRGPDSFLPEVTYPDDIPLTAILKIRNFKYANYLSLHKKIFKDIQKNNIKNLVIDLRDNSGGQEDIGIDLMRYLMVKNFSYTPMSEGFVNINSFLALIKNTNDKALPPIDVSLIAHGFYQTRYDKNVLQDMQTNTFRGQIFILVNGGTFSAASLFATALKRQRNCVIIGEETGGGVAGDDGGTIVDVTLPETRLNLRLPLLWTYSVSEEPGYGKGLMPDINFEPSVKDIYYQYTKHIDPIIPVVKNAIAAADNKTK